MIRMLCAVIFFAWAVNAQNFQPPSWGQGRGQGQGQAQGQAKGQGQGQGQSDGLQQQINQLQSQIERLRAQQRQQNQPHVEAQTGPVVGHPVSGKETRRTTQTLMDGTPVDRSETSYFYRDAAGRMRAGGPNSVEIFDPVSHFAYQINSAKKTYFRESLSGNVAFVSLAAFGNESHSHISSDAGYSNSQTQPDVSEELGRQMVNGVMAKGSRVTITIPAGALGNNRNIKVVNERWYSEELQILIKSINNDPRFGVNVYELTEIKQTAPAPSLFEPPPDYTLTIRGN